MSQILRYLFMVIVGALVAISPAAFAETPPPPPIPQLNGYCIVQFLRHDDQFNIYSAQACSTCGSLELQCGDTHPINPCITCTPAGTCTGQTFTDCLVFTPPPPPTPMPSPIPPGSSWHHDHHRDQH